MHQEVLSQTLGTHQENSVCYYGIVVGCAVAPNNAMPSSGPLSLGTFSSVSMAQTPFPTNNSGGTIIVVTPGGNALPVPDGGTIRGSPDGKYIHVKNPDGSTGVEIHPGHGPRYPGDLSHADPKGQQPHSHVPGVTNPDGTPWLPVRPEPTTFSTGEKALIGAGAVGGGYLIYRGIRMVPSLVIPPLWPTIPINAVVP